MRPSSPGGDWAAPLALTLVALVAASAARHGLVEPADVTARCDAAPWSDLACVLRMAVVQTFVEQRLGWLAVLAGGLATLLRWRWLAWLGLVAGSAGLVLYCAGPAAVGALLSALVCARPPSLARGVAP
jgi:hypothetical protein